MVRSLIKTDMFSRKIEGIFQPFGIFQHPSCRQTSKKSKRGPFEETSFQKNSQCRKKLKGGPFRIF